jgi:perosamine synthetase
MDAWPTVSIIIPCRNEVRFIASCLDSVLANGFPLERLEILVVDGMSDDGTREAILNYAARYSLITLLDNPHKVTPYALNIGIREAKGDVVMRLDAHTVCQRDYIERCIRVLFEYGADDVGGRLRIIARDDTVTGRAIAEALTQRFGVGNLRYRFSRVEAPEVVDTFAFFCCRRSLFQRIGLFNEKLTRCQDMEFKRRLARAGCKIMLAPGAFADYQARSDLKSFWRHNWSDGVWAALAFGHARLMPVRWRHLAPAGFVGALLLTGLLALPFAVFRWVFVALAGTYSLAALAVSARIAVADADLRYLFLIPLIIGSMHLTRGIGSLWGGVRLLTEGRLAHAIRLLLEEQSGPKRASNGSQTGSRLAFSEENTFYFYRGRVALYALLRALKIQPGDEVLIPGFTCSAVPSPVLGMLARPVYVDIDPRTYNIDPVDLERRVTNRSKVIVAQHTFGIPCDMDAIMATAQQHGLAVIEDTCQVWGSKYKKKDLGSFGVAAFYSYDPGKPFIIGMGGAARVNSEQLRAEMGNLYGNFKKPRAMETAKLHTQYAAYRLTKHPRLFWGVRNFYRFLSKKGVTIGTWPSDTFEGRLGADYQKGLSPSLIGRLRKMTLRGDGVISRHKRLAEQYERGLRAIGISGLGINSDCEAVLICYPLQVAKKARLLEEARKSRVELGDWFSSPVHPLSEPDWSAVGYQKGSCPVAEEVSRSIITLPCHAGVTPKEAERTLRFLKKMKELGLLCSAAPATEPGSQLAGVVSAALPHS